MTSNIYLFCFIIVFFGMIRALPHYRFRRQINSPKNDGFPYDKRAPMLNTPSGSIHGSSYYGIGSDPNYGSFIQKPNSAGGSGILPISYNSNSNLFAALIKPTHQHQQNLQQQQQNYLYNNYNNNNNAWQRPYRNNDYNQFYNRYPPGSQGWYATGGNYWYNNGQSIIAHPYLLMISIAILIFCK